MATEATKSTENKLKINLEVKNYRLTVDSCSALQWGQNLFRHVGMYGNLITAGNSGRRDY